MKIGRSSEILGFLRFWRVFVRKQGGWVPLFFYPKRKYLPKSFPPLALKNSKKNDEKMEDNVHFLMFRPNFIRDKGVRQILVRTEDNRKKLNFYCFGFIRKPVR